jgi:predicted RNA binding protein YcfA (HicA-like mRNA interferase family)
MANATYTYGLLDEKLRDLGFTVHTQKDKARIYRHEQTGARIILPDAPFDEDVLPHHLAVVRHVLEEHNIGDVNRGAREMDLNQRRQAVQQIDSVRAKMLATYGEMPDSTTLIREDRER